MPRLPSLNRVTQEPASASGVHVDPRSTAGLDLVAGSLGVVGEAMAKSKIEELDRNNKYDSLKVEREFMEHMNKAELGLDPETPATWDKTMKDASTTFRDGLSERELAPESRDAIGQRLLAYESMAMIRTTKAAKIKGLRNLSVEYDLANKVLLDSGNFEGLRALLDDQAKQLQMTNAEVGGAHREIDIAERKWNFDRDLADDPFNTKSTGRGFTEVEKRLADREILSAQVREQARIIDEIQDGIVADDGTITPENIDTYTENLTPTQKEKIDDWVAKKYDDDYLKKISSPENQAILRGQIGEGLENYTPIGGDRQDDQYIKLSRMIDMVSDTHRKKEMKKNLDSIRDGAKADLKKANVQIGKTVGEVIEEMWQIKDVKIHEPTVGSYIDEGFFRDVPKMMSLGASESEVEDVEGAKQKNKPSTYADQIKAFQVLWKKKLSKATDSEGNLLWKKMREKDPEAWAFIEIIKDGGTAATVVRKFDDPQDKGRHAEATEDRQYLRGVWLTKAEDWADSLNVPPTPDEITEKIKEYADDYDSWRRTERPDDFEDWAQGLLPKKTPKSGYATEEEAWEAWGSSREAPEAGVEKRWGRWYMVDAESEPAKPSPDPEWNKAMEEEEEGETDFTERGGGPDESAGLLSPKGANAATPTRTTSDNLVDMVKQIEAGGAKDGFFPEAYPDGRQWSIGYGTKSFKGETITKVEADKRLRGELAKAGKHVKTYNKTYKWKPHELDALTSFAYNVGNISELTANGTRSREQIAAKILEYNKATIGGKKIKLKGLVNRRKSEQDLFLNGYPKSRKVAKKINLI